MLKALGQTLMAHKEEFYAKLLATGATRADGWIDIEGGIGTLLAYASKGRRELPNTRVLTEGAGGAACRRTAPSSASTS